MEQEIVGSVDAALAYADSIGLPIRIQSEFSLKWQKIAYNREEMQQFAAEGLGKSPTGKLFLSPHTEQFLD